MCRVMKIGTNGDVQILKLMAQWVIGTGAIADDAHDTIAHRAPLARLFSSIGPGVDALCNLLPPLLRHPVFGGSAAVVVSHAHLLDFFDFFQSSGIFSDFPGDTLRAG